MDLLTTVIVHSVICNDWRLFTTCSAENFLSWSFIIVIITIVLTSCCSCNIHLNWCSLLLWISLEVKGELLSLYPKRIPHMTLYDNTMSINNTNPDKRSVNSGLCWWVGFFLTCTHGKMSHIHYESIEVILYLFKDIFTLSCVQLTISITNWELKSFL